MNRQDNSAVHYPIKDAKGSSHEIVLRLVGRSQSLLDVGCGEGFMAKKLVDAGNSVVGIDILEVPKLREIFADYYSSSLDEGIGPLLPELKKHSFDQILLMDILEHLAAPEKLLNDLREVSGPQTRFIISVPNVANATVRLALLLGRFEYTDRGILDRTHLRFWTVASIRRFLESQGLEILSTQMTVMPVELALKMPAQHPLIVCLNAVLRVMTRIFPRLLGYQTILVARYRSA